MALPSIFEKSRELVNYDYFDIAEGVGYTIYFGLKGDDGEFLVTTTSNLFSEEICSFLVDEGLTTTFVKKFDLDFDLKFNLPKNIKGKIYVNVPIGVSADPTGSNTKYFAVVIAKHFDGSTETTLATGTSRTVSQTVDVSTTAHSSMMAVCKCDVTTQRHFKKDETLRFTVEGWFRTDSGTDIKHLMIGHDPKNTEWRDGTRTGQLNTEMALANEPTGGGTVVFQNTQMAMHVPFVLDV